MAKRGPKGPLTNEHKAALVQGRSEGKIVRDYLEALRTNKPKRGRKRTIDSVKARLDAIESEMPAADALSELKLRQERADLQLELTTVGATVDLSALEASFVAIAKGFSDRQGIAYATWREVGVEPSVLKAAGITLSSR
jgi:hypothetical protein